MRDLIDLVERLDYQPSSWGWWIEGDGSIVAITNGEAHGHHLKRKLAPDRTENDDVPWGLAYEAGWIRVVSPERYRGGEAVLVQFQSDHVTKRALSTLDAFLADMGWRKVFLDMGRDYKDFELPRHARGYLRTIDARS